MNNNFTINPYDKVLIIGNGFDLDLGLATRYSDFASKSDFFNVFFLNSELNRHLQNASTNEKWLDMELELEKYAQRSSVGHFLGIYLCDSGYGSGSLDLSGSGSSSAGFGLSAVYEKILSFA